MRTEEAADPVSRIQPNCTRFLSCSNCEILKAVSSHIGGVCFAAIDNESMAL